MTTAARDTAWGGSGGGNPPTIPPLYSLDDLNVGANELIRGGYPRIDAKARGALFDGSTDDTAALLDCAQRAHALGGAVVMCPQGTAKISALSLAGLTGVRFLGLGRAQSCLAFSTTTGTVVDMTNTQFCGFEDMLIRPFSAQKTGGELFKLNASAGSCQQNSFAGLNLASCYRAFNLGSVSSTLIDDVLFQDFNASWPWHSVINMTGAAISTIITRLRGGSGGNSGIVFLVDAGLTVDSVLASNWEVAAQPGTSMAGVNINSGEWFRFSNISIEAGANANAFDLPASSTTKGVSLTNFHLLGFKGIAIGGGKNLIFADGEVLACQREGIYAAAFATIKHLKLRGIVVSDCGLATTNTYDGIYITAGVNDFAIEGCTSDDASVLGSTNRVRYGCNIDAANDRFTIRGNHFYGSTGKFNNAAGTSATKVADGNI